jgi:hypothetical protein
MSHVHGDHSVHSTLDERRLPPSGQGTVVLDIGDGVGALVVHTASDLSGVEIEIARRGETNAFVHTEVRERVLPEGSMYAGVFLSLDEGDYTLLAVGQHPPRDVTIRSGAVTEVDAK